MGSGGQEEHVEERVRKGAAVMGKVWGLGQRLFGKDWGRRIWLFDRLVWAVVGYGGGGVGFGGEGESGGVTGEIPEVGAGGE